MKKYYFFFVVFLAISFQFTFCNAQVKIVTSVAGAYISGGSLTGEWLPATIANIAGATGVAVDDEGNVYLNDYGFSRLRRVDASSGLIHTVAGTGIATFSGDGGPASAAAFNHAQSIVIDRSGNIYVTDAGNMRIRRIDKVTGIITTVAGGGASSADGIPATNASIGAARCVAVDTSGTLHFIDNTGKMRLVSSSTGTVSTIAGINANWMVFDRNNNIYFSTSGLIKKRDAVTSAVTIVAGGGTSLVDGAPALSANLAGYNNFCIDTVGNIYLGNGTLIREIDGPTNHIHTIAGCGASYAEGIPAIEAYAGNSMFCLDKHGNIYYSNGVSNVRRISVDFSGYDYFSTSTFNVTINKFCFGPQITVITNTPGVLIKASYGDGKIDTATALTGCATGTDGYAVFNHDYQHNGTYTIKLVYYIGSVPIDSVHHTYEHVFCNAIPIKFYLDVNNNCVNDGENFNQLPILTEIDSNGVAIDTISATNGMYYNAYGSIGDVYRFKPFAFPAGIQLTCPSSGIITDTLVPLLYNTTYREFGLDCSMSTGFDLRIHSSMRAGPHQLGGIITIDNSFCAYLPATVTAQLSPKYHFDHSSLAPALVSGNTVTWNIILSNASGPTLISLDCEKPAGATFSFGDTAITSYTISPIAGDVFPTDNISVRVDTVRSGFDPNYIEVSPGLCLTPSVKTLTYTIHFENTGNDTAFNIYVLDTLPSYLNSKSLRIITASADMDISMIREGGYNIVKFNFPNINLLDSSHHGLSEAMVKFTIDLFNGIADDTHIPNRAGIYFDANPVVMTNTVENITRCTTGISGITIDDRSSISPNPVVETLTINIGQDDYHAFSITNNIGQILLQRPLNSKQTNVDVKNLAPGMYYITLKGAQGIKVEKFVKL